MLIGITGQAVKTCSADNCNGRVVTKGLCGKHRQRLERLGSLADTPAMRRRSEDWSEQKQCMKCGQNKPRSEYFKCSRKRDGLQVYCKPCQESYRANSQGRYRILERESQRRRAKENPQRAMWARSKKGASERGIPFDLLPEDIEIPVKCPVFGIDLIYFGAGESPCAASLDRIDNSKGYVKGNVAVISKRANTIKANATADELRAIADYIDRELSCLSV